MIHMALSSILRQQEYCGTLIGAISVFTGPYTCGVGTIDNTGRLCTYTSVDEHEDLERRDELFKKWKRGKRPYQLTSEEDAEEAHLYGRIAAYRAARGRDSKRMRALKELGDKRTAVEQNELDALEARYRHLRSNSLRLVAP